jgi:hypothetical protein
MEATIEVSGLFRAVTSEQQAAARAIRSEKA